MYLICELALVLQLLRAVSVKKFPLSLCLYLVKWYQVYVALKNSGLKLEVKSWFIVTFGKLTVLSVLIVSYVKWGGKTSPVIVL